MGGAEESRENAKALVVLENIELNLSSTAGEVNILRGLDLTVDRGERLGVVGPSGSGKTTMLMIIAGLERPSAGTVHVAGSDLADMDEDGLALFRREHVGIVFQAYHLVPTMTALENTAVPLEFGGIRDAFEQAQEALEAVGLGHRLGHYPAQLSGGEQQRVALARAVVTKPDLLLADEPTGNLDRETGGTVMELLFELQAARDASLLLITHDPDLTARCDRVVHMVDGRFADGADTA